MSDSINENELVPVESSEVMKAKKDEKTLYITPGMKSFDYKSILNRLVQYVNIENVISQISPTSQYMVHIPMRFQKGYETGEFFIMQNKKTGIQWPTLMRISETGKQEIVSPLPIVEQKGVKGNPFQDISNSYYHVLMQQQIDAIMYKLDAVYQKVCEIEQGQMDDRIGLLEAGKTGVLLALSMKDEELKRHQIVASCSNLLVAQGQIGRTLKTLAESFEPLPKTRVGRVFEEYKHNGYLIEKDREFARIQKYYSLYLESTRLIAEAYLIIGEELTATNSFEKAKEVISEISFDNVKTIQYDHPRINIDESFLCKGVQFIETEKKECLEESKPYDSLSIEVNGQMLIEKAKELENDERRKVSRD